MTIFTGILLGFLVICAIAASLSKSLLNTILIFMSYSLVMSVIWILLESPDLAITEAAVGAGVTTVLFLVTLKKIRAIMNEDDGKEAGDTVSPKKQFRTDQAAATMAIEDMPLTGQAHQNLIDAATGLKTTDETAAEITKRYQQ